jgi:hypothetical protein
MAATNATSVPVYGQAFRLKCRIVSSNTGNPFTSGLTGLGAQISKDDGTFANTTNTPVEISPSSGSGSGYVYLDLTATEMTCSSCIVRVFATNTYALDYSVEIVPRQLGQFTGRWDAQSVLKMEQLMLELHILMGGNGATQTGAQLQHFNPDGSVHFQSTVVQNATTGTRSKPA